MKIAMTLLLILFGLVMWAQDRKIVDHREILHEVILRDEVTGKCVKLYEFVRRGETLYDVVPCP